MALFEFFLSFFSFLCSFQCIQQLKANNSSGSKVLLIYAIGETTKFIQQLSILITRESSISPESKSTFSRQTRSLVVLAIQSLLNSVIQETNTGTVLLDHSSLCAFVFQTLTNIAVSQPQMSGEYISGFICRFIVCCFLFHR